MHMLGGGMGAYVSVRYVWVGKVYVVTCACTLPSSPAPLLVLCQGPRPFIRSRLSSVADVASTIASFMAGIPLHLVLYASHTLIPCQGKQHVALTASCTRQAEGRGGGYVRGGVMM